MELPKRRNIRLKDYDYSQNGAYFITVCVKDRHELLGKIVVGDDAHIVPNAHIVPKIDLTEYGLIVQKYIENINAVYSEVSVDKFIIMPNHVHMILFVHGTMRASSPTSAPIPSVVRSLKTMVTKECGFSFWQRAYHDHIIRNEEDYLNHWRYIEENLSRWAEDEYYGEIANETHFRYIAFIMFNFNLMYPKPPRPTE